MTTQPALDAAGVIVGLIVIVALLGGLFQGDASDEVSPTPEPSAPTSSVLQGSVLQALHRLQVADLKPAEPDMRSGVHPGAFCSPAGARGTTSTGRVMTCKGPGQPRWRS